MKNYINHSIRVASLSHRLATFLALNSKAINSIYKLSLLHDIGKTKVSSEILNKLGALNREEFEQIKDHSFYGYEILLESGLPIEEAKTILYHHENYDGSGYPGALKGEEIPLGARIIRVCDTFDALTSDRPYRKMVYIDEAIGIMTSDDEIKHFDSKILRAFLEVIKEGSIVDFKSFRERK